MNAHEYSKLATLLDIGAVGGVALESVLGRDLSPSDLWKRLLLGSASEGLMVLASRQYVKAFLEETTAVYQSAAWFLFHELWRLSLLNQPELAPETRRMAIDQMLAPIHDNTVNGTLKVVLIGRVFQMLLLIRLSMSIQESEISAWA
jgi:hypothetical protein